MKTADMWKYAQVHKEVVFKSDDLRYQEGKGFINCETKKNWSPRSFDNFTDPEGNNGLAAFMNLDWEEVCLSVHQLDPKKQYIANRSARYKVNKDGRLYSYLTVDRVWVPCPTSYNTIIAMKFIEANDLINHDNFLEEL